MIRMFVPVTMAAMATTATAANAQDAAVRTLVERFEGARAQFDPVALAQTLAPDYEEVSPIGEVDARAKVIGFYAPEKKQPMPAMTDDEVTFHADGGLALTTVRKSFTAPNGMKRSIRVRYVARRMAGGWLLVSVQYTPIPPARAG